MVVVFIYPHTTEHEIYFLILADEKTHCEHKIHYFASVMHKLETTGW